MKFLPVIDEQEFVDSDVGLIIPQRRLSFDGLEILERHQAGVLSRSDAGGDRSSSC